MASVDTGSNNPNDPNNPNNVPGNVNQPGGQTNQPATTGGAGGVTATGAGNITGQVTGTANPSQPFNNIASYLSANAPGGQNLANQVASTVSQPITDAKTGISSAAQDFTKSVNAGYAPENKDLTTAVSQNPAYVVAENPDNVTNFLGQLHDTYTGPTDFTQSNGYADLQGKIANAQSKAANTKNEAGIQTLLGSVEGPTTAGINKLDSLLLSTDPANYKTIQTAGAGASELTPTLNQTAADQNALAAAGTTNASTAATNAAAALQAALKGESGNLSTEQNTIQGIVDAYNKSVGIINPVTQTIAQDIQNFLAANPQLSLSDATSALAPLMNLNSINAPSESTYASPYDYQTIQALAKLGLDPSALSGLPISADTANLAQTFQVPQQLQDAIGKAPGVESALNTELNTLGGQITGAFQPFQDLQQAETQRSTLAQQMSQNSDQIKQLNMTLASQQNALTSASTPIEQKQIQNGIDATKASIATLTSQNTDANSKLQALFAKYGASQSYSGDINRMAQGLQWLDPASKGYNDLISQINAELGKLGSVGIPTLNYSASAPAAVKAGAPIGQVAAKDVGKTANLAAAGAAGASGVGAGITEAATAPFMADLAAEEGGALTGGTTSPLAAGLQGFGETLGPAAVAAYGASNIAQNAAANPIQSGLMTLANTGLSLATLSLPPQVFQSIGKEINSVLNSIGDFFGSLF